MKSFVSVAALVNFIVTIWHLYLAEKLNPTISMAESTRIAMFAGLLTLAGAALLWTRRPKMGSLVLIAVFAIGLVIGSEEHFFIAGPNNVFDIGNGDWTLPFKISVALLVSLEVTGLSAAGRLLTRF